MGVPKRRSNRVDFILPVTMYAAVSEQLSALPTLGRRTFQLPTAAAAPLRQLRKRYWIHVKPLCIKCYLRTFGTFEGLIDPFVRTHERKKIKVGSLHVGMWVGIVSKGWLIVWIVALLVELITIYRDVN